jgi:mono/diheme cytochrome c family protein
MIKMIRFRVILAAVLSLASPVAFAQSSGADIYIPKCAGCHGTNGIVVSEVSKGMGTRDATDPYIKSLTANRMFSSVKNGKRGMNGTFGMPPFKNRLTDAQIRDAVAFYRELGTAVPNASALLAQAPGPDVSNSVQGLGQTPPSPAQGYPQVLLSGWYFQPKTGARFQINSDGSFVLVYSDQHVVPGHFAVNGNTLVMTYPNGDALSSTLTIQENNIYLNGSLAWVWQGNAPGGQVAPLKFPSIYVSAQTPADQLQLNSDNSFSLQEDGQPYHGTFEANGNTLELSISETSTKTALSRLGDSLIDGSGQTWIFREQFAGSAPHEDVLRNEDIIRMVKAGFDDSIIIAKVSGSKCQFDTSVDTLIELKKQGGVSAPVLKAMVAAGK